MLRHCPTDAMVADALTKFGTNTILENLVNSMNAVLPEYPHQQTTSLLPTIICGQLQSLPVDVKILVRMDKCYEQVSEELRMKDENNMSIWKNAVGLAEWMKKKNEEKRKKEDDIAILSELLPFVP